MVSVLGLLLLVCAVVLDLSYVKLQWASMSDLDLVARVTHWFVIVNEGFPFFDVLGSSLVMGIS
jgi:hypothetical protein